MRKIGPGPSGCGANRAILRCRPRRWTRHSRRPPPRLARFLLATPHTRKLITGSSPLPPAHRKERDTRGTASHRSAHLFKPFDQATCPATRQQTRFHNLAAPARAVIPRSAATKDLRAPFGNRPVAASFWSNLRIAGLHSNNSPRTRIFGPLQGWMTASA